jgi:hypothetical protein
MARFMSIAGFLLVVAGMFLAAHAADETRGSFVASAPSPIAFLLGDGGLDERAYLSADCDENCAFGKVGEDAAEKHRIYGSW